MSDFISEDILLNIFKRSTPNTLLRCRCVCHWWRALISDPSFIAAHLAAQKPRLILRESTDSQSIRRENYFLFRPQPNPSFDLCFQADRLRNFYMIGTANGVICIVDEIFGVTGTIVLWNPLIHKHIYPPPPIHSSKNSSTLGFGFDPSTNDLKIVRIVWNSRRGRFGRREHFMSNAEVFSLRESRWRSIDIDTTPDLCMFTNPLCTNRWSQLLLNGAAHWTACLRRTRVVLLSFHFEREEFKIIDLPKKLPRAPVYVSKIGPLLSVLTDKRTLRVTDDPQGFDLWAMKVYGDASSWSKMVSLSWGGGGVTSVLWVREDAEEMLVSTADDEILSCDSDKRNTKLLDVRCKGDGYYAHDFVGSLVLLDHGN